MGTVTITDVSVNDAWYNEREDIIGKSVTILAEYRWSDGWCAVHIEPITIPTGESVTDLYEVKYVSD